MKELISVTEYRPSKDRSFPAEFLNLGTLKLASNRWAKTFEPGRTVSDVFDFSSVINPRTSAASGLRRQAAEGA